MEWILVGCFIFGLLAGFVFGFVKGIQKGTDICHEQITKLVEEGKIKISK